MKMIRYLFVVLLVYCIVVSCQSESVSEETVALTATSQLTDVLKSMSVNNTEADNVIDSTSCFKIKLPVNVVVNGNFMTISVPSQYESVKAAFNQSQDDNDTVELVFPLIVEDADYNETTVNSQAEFDTMIQSCSPPAQNIGDQCVSLAFPISVYTYNSGFQIQSTYVLNGNKDLYIMLNDLGPNEYYSMGYPVSLNVKDGAGISAYDNYQLSDAIDKALQGCQEGGCTNPKVLIDGLSLYITFSGGVVKDLKGGEVAVSDDVTFTSDRNGNQNCAAVFNGSPFIKVSKSVDNAIVQGQAYSISLWFRMQNTINGNFERFFSKGDVDGEGFQLAANDLNAPVFVAGDYTGLIDTDWKNDAALPVDVTNWHHLVVTVDEQNNIVLYRDGQIRNAENASAIAIGSEAMDYYIGKGFIGFLDDLRVYKKKLSASEVQTLFELEGDCNTCLE